ncbi:DUF1853 family protein [Luteolibacter sp. AS25]|uniref:DUF1853 family protein n=1 Tax=Luteolibacter sp. AS25 TaxID=3135776 RepID=UPI00398BB629
MSSTSSALFHSLTQGPLLIGSLPEASTFPFTSLQLPENPSPLNLEQKLGHLYEDALATLIQASPRYRLLEQSLQLRKIAGHTLGELDYLLEDLPSRQIIHLELAVKFYLAVQTPGALLLPGPNARDNYFRKLEKMRTHQLVLTGSHRELLPPEYRNQKITTRQLVYGCLFDHIHTTEPATPEFLNPNARRGKWLHADQCTEYFGENTRLEIIPKPLWPVPLDFIKDTPLEKWEIDTEIDRCLMVRTRTKPTPYFIAPIGYPETCQ